MAPPTREMRQAPISLGAAIKRAQDAADAAQAKVKTLEHYLKIIKPHTGHIASVKDIQERLESIYGKLEDLWEEE